MYRLLASSGTRSFTNGRYYFIPGELLQLGEQLNRNGLLLSLGQRYPRCSSSFGQDKEGLSRRWKLFFRGKQQAWSSIEPCHASQPLSRESDVLALMAHELKRRGDFRFVDDLSDFEFNYLYLDVVPASLDCRDDTAPNMSTTGPFINQQIGPNFLRPRIYSSESSAWTHFDKGIGTLRRGHILKIASWNLWFSRLGAAARASAALAHLRTMFGEEPHNLVVMFQELRQESLEAILEDRWARQNFVLSDTEPPAWLDGDNKSLGPGRYFTAMMVSKTLPISNCFRIPFVSKMGRDALVVDIPVSEDRGPNESQELLRLCTTHLESLYSGKEFRFRQLTVISALLKGDIAQGRRICGGLVGGDMNSVDTTEHSNHRAPEVDLKDVWEDEPVPTPPVLKPFQKDVTFGQARGNTWGYQSDNAKTRKRLDKFLYTGSIETFAVNETQDVTGNLGRFGIGLKTKVGLNDMWVSDHFGITVGIKVV